MGEKNLLKELFSKQMILKDQVFNTRLDDSLLLIVPIRPPIDQALARVILMQGSPICGKLREDREGLLALVLKACRIEHG